MPSHRYLHLDVFTDRRFSGNQLAVFPDAGDLDPSLFQPIAAEMAFSETTFVLPAETPGTDARMRIFTPGTELPMAGHPTVGSAFALAHEGRIGAEHARFVFGLGVGATPVDLEWLDDRLVFAWMSQPLPTFEPGPADVAGVARALGVGEEDVRGSGLPVEQASSGVPALLVPLVSRRAVDAVVLDERALPALLDAASRPRVAVFVFTLAGGGDDGATAYCRMFAPALGVQEDPATGGVSGPLGCYLLRHGVVTPAQARRLTSVQGVAMGRPSRIHVDVHAPDGRPQRVRVGGQSVLVAEGVLRL